MVLLLLPLSVSRRRSLLGFVCVCGVFFNHWTFHHVARWQELLRQGSSLLFLLLLGGSWYPVHTFICLISSVLLLFTACSVNPLECLYPRAHHTSVLNYFH